MPQIEVIPLNELSKRLKKEPERHMKEARPAVRRALLQSIPDLVKKSPIDTGLYASSWDMTETEKSLILGNFAPHAAVIEFGARPFTPPIAPLLAWAKRVLGDPSQPPDYSPKVRSLAYGVRDKIRKQGMMPRHILKNEIPNIVMRIKKELQKLE